LYIEFVHQTSLLLELRRLKWGARFSEKLEPPDGSSKEEVEIGECEPGMEFGDFAKRTFRKNSSDAFGATQAAIR
jgi:hypothetical protein